MAVALGSSLRNRPSKNQMTGFLAAGTLPVSTAFNLLPARGH
jgi:hypothetical protein